MEHIDVGIPLGGMRLERDDSALAGQAEID